MRYLGRFPSEQQIVDAVLPKILEDDASPGISLEKLETAMVESKILIFRRAKKIVLLSKDFWPDNFDDLLLCFKKLDK